MKYKKIDILTSEEGIELVLGALMGIDIVDAVVENPKDVDELLDKEHDYDWDYVDEEVINLKNETPTVNLYVNEEDPRGMDKRVAEIIDAVNGVKSIGKELGCDIEIQVTDHDDSEWKDNWKEFFKPKRVSEKIIVKPTWESYELTEEDMKNGSKILEIDPGMAFGTGTHETTSLCIRALEGYMKKGDRVLDVGTGSGILAIAAALLGSSDVLGVDIDPVAVKVSEENVALNGVEDRVTTQYGDLTKGIDYTADVVVANLMADLVILLSKDVSKHLKRGGFYISSGIIEEKLVKVVDSIRACGFAIMEVKQDGMWCCVVAKK